jgi:predicted outer membrane repeat protein
MVLVAVIPFRDMTSRLSSAAKDRNWTGQRRPQRLAGTLTVSDCTVSGNTASQGGGIYNAGTMTVENSSSIAGDTAPDVYNLGVLYLDSTSTIGALDDNPATPI